MIHDRQYYLDTFNVTAPQLDRLVAEGLSRGGDYSDLYFENTTYGNIMLRDGEVTSGGMHEDYGVGVRVLSGDKTGYAYSESTALNDILACADRKSVV